MPITQPKSFVEAVRFMVQKGIMPTNLDTNGLRQLSRETREQSFFSARNYLEQVLGGAQKTITSILDPQQVRRADRVTAENPEGWVTEGFNPTTARVEIKRLLDEAGYQPEPGKEGTLQDLSSDARINLVIETNRDLALGKGFKLQGQDPAVLEAMPGWELIRVIETKQQRDWMNRFRMAGEQSGSAIGDGWTITPGGRMAALKGHPIWTALGSSALFDDALDVDYPPFAFNSGMRVEELTRAECEEMGLALNPATTD